MAAQAGSAFPSTEKPGQPGETKERMVEGRSDRVRAPGSGDLGPADAQAARWLLQFPGASSSNGSSRWQQPT
ncbi:unnamed protein product [Symbiodinium sp. KB8]|nr:unnamed protein product [Symbiodinium sp. KB8]